MTFNLFNRLILWLKKIFHIRPKSKHEKKELPAEVLHERKPVELPQQPEETSIKIVQIEEKPGEVSAAEEKPVEVPLLEEKIIDVTRWTEKRASETPKKDTISDIFQKQSGEKILRTEGIQESDKSPKKTQPAKIKEEDALKLPKPYKKKSPMEERKREPIKLPITERKMASPEQREPIYLGPTQKRTRRLTGEQQKFPSDENIETEIADKAPKEKGFDTIVESPFVEIDLDNGKVYLILPQQQLKPKPVDQTPSQLTYAVILNGTRQEVPAKIINGKDGRILVEEKRIFLEEPLMKFQVVFPNELQAREYNYNHNGKEIYAFVAIGNNRGRMYYLNDKEGNINPLPQRVIWVLVHEEFELQTVLGPSDITEDISIWERYQAFRIDLSEIDALVIKNRMSGEEKSFALQSTFRVEGEQLIEDGYKKECPLFTGKTLKIVAPYENQSGWSVWIQNKAAGYKVKENWTCREPLTLRLPDDLPCEFGEFQIDICQQNTRIPNETLFFRLMPCIELNYPEELIIPDPKSGHIPLTISIRLDSNDEWELEYRGNRETKVKLKQHNFYEIELPPEEDTFRFTLAKTSRPESIVNFQITVPRLKWKTLEQKNWEGKSQQIERKDLKPGETFYLLIKTNDFDNKYDLLALLKANGQKLQEGKFIRKGAEYCLELNQFFDTIKHNKNEVILKAEVCKSKNKDLLGNPEIFYFQAEPVEEIDLSPKPVSYDPIRTISMQRICFVLRRVKVLYPKNKSTCKKILQFYYDRCRGKKAAKDDTDLHKRRFILKSLAFLKFVTYTYGDRIQIRNLRKWKKRITLVQEETPNEFNEEYKTFERMTNHATRSH